MSLSCLCGAASALWGEEVVKSYVARRVEHHEREDFRSELLKMLVAHGVEFDEGHVLD